MKHHKSKCKMNYQMDYFLAGLIDADGHISKKCVSISFHKRDIEVAQSIQSYIGHGTLREISGKNALSYDVYSLVGSSLLGHLILHKLRNPNRIVQFNTRLVPRIQIAKTVVANGSLMTNRWLAGFIQGDGSFQIKLTPRISKTPYRFQLVIQIDQKTNILLKMIQDEFGGSVSYRKFQNTYYYSSGSFVNAKLFIDYLDTYQVLGLNWELYALWRSAYLLTVEKKHLTHDGLKTLILLKDQLSVLKNKKDFYKKKSFMLEPYALKGARTVLKGYKPK